MNFDLSALEKLQEKGTETKVKKFAPTNRARPRPTASKQGRPQPGKQVPARSESKAAPAPQKVAGAEPTASQAARKQEHANSSAPKLAASSTRQAKSAPAPPLDSKALAAPVRATSKARRATKTEHVQSPQHDTSQDSLAAQQPGRTRRQQERQRKAVSAAVQGAQEEKDPGTSAPELALVPANAEGGSAQHGQQQSGAEAKGKEKLVIDPSTMSLKAIIKCAYAQERKRMEEERKRKKEEEERLQAEGSAPATTPAKPRQDRARAAPSPAQPAPSLAPQVQMVNGRLMVVQNSLTVQAQAEDLQRPVTVEDNPKLNNASYSNRLNNDRWTPQETELFFKAIALFGTDFSLMEKMFPGRQRKALKLKLRREYKDNAERVDAALSGKGSGAKSYQEVVNALHRHTENQDSNPILGMVPEDPDLADVLRGSAPGALGTLKEGTEVADVAAEAPQPLSNQAGGQAPAAWPGPGLGRKGRASAKGATVQQPSNAAQAQQQAASPAAEQPSASAQARPAAAAGRRRGKAVMATIPEEPAATEQPEGAKPEEASAPKAAPVGGRRRKRSAAAADASASGDAQEAGQNGHAGAASQPAAASSNQPAGEPAAERPHGPNVRRSAPQAPRVVPRVASRRKRQTPVAAAAGASMDQGPAKRARGLAQPAELKLSEGKPKSRVELLAEAAGAMCS